MPVDLASLTKISNERDLVGIDDEDTGQLRAMHVAAMDYIKSFKWSKGVTETFFGMGLGGVFSIFLFRFDALVGGTDEFLWVVEGDIPSAYLVADDAETPEGAARVYFGLTEDWANAVLQGRALDDVFPVAA
jgi:hypothetical protein